MSRLGEANFLLGALAKPAARGDTTFVAGLLFRVVGLLAHALHAKAGRWVINEKGLIDAPDCCLAHPQILLVVRMRHSVTLESRRRTSMTLLPRWRAFSPKFGRAEWYISLPWPATSAARPAAQRGHAALAPVRSGRKRGSGSTTSVGTKMAAGNVRRDFRRALALVPGIDPSEWTPRELRHSFVSVLSDAGVPVEEISRLVGHSGTTVTELVYRHQLKPVIQTGATVMDQLFGRKSEGALAPSLAPGALGRSRVRSKTPGQVGGPKWNSQPLTSALSERFRLQGKPLSTTTDSG